MSINTSNARGLRKNQTPWENQLWYLLRNRRFKDFKFRRQTVIGKCIVDFCSVKGKLVIELDGGGHNNLESKVKDFNRDKFLKSKGYRVLRIWNNELDNNLEGVLQEIYKNLIA